MPTIATVFFSRTVTPRRPPADHEILSFNGVNLTGMPYIFERSPEGGSGGNRINRATRGKRMGRLIKLVLGLAVLGFLGLVAYAYVADLTPAPQEVRAPVTLNAD
jgi:hypothetical protein